MKVTICGHEYQVKYTTQGMLDETNEGEADLDNCVIRINNHISKSKQHEAEIHEIIECIKASLDLNLCHTTLTALANGLYVFIQQNKDFSQRWWK